jgi:hypothetical protein
MALSVKLPNLKMKTRPKQLLGFLPWISRSPTQQNSTQSEDIICKDIQRNDTQNNDFYLYDATHDDIQHNNIHCDSSQYYDIVYSGIELNDIQYKTLNDP